VTGSHLINSAQTATYKLLDKNSLLPCTLLQVGRVLPGPAGKLQELAAAGALQQANPQTLGLKPGSVTGLSPSQAATQLDAAFLSSSWGAAEARADEDAAAAGKACLVAKAASFQRSQNRNEPKIHCR
jgi:hypothetical protein